MADKNGKLTAWEIVNGNLLAMKMKDQVYIEVCDWELETIRTELEKYSKYKRAFELLINHGLKIVRNIDMESEFGICFKNCVITGQEFVMLYELLEELMK